MKTEAAEAQTGLVTWYCRDCGSLEIHHDGILKWNPQNTNWEVLSSLDDSWCEDCLRQDPKGQNTGDPIWGVPPNERPVKPVEAPPAVKSLDILADGEPNFWTVSDPKRWIARIQFNGELRLPQQAAIAADFKAAMIARDIEPDPLTIAYIGNGVRAALDDDTVGMELYFTMLAVKHAPLLQAEWKRRYGDNGIRPGQARFSWTGDIAERFGREYAKLLINDQEASPRLLIIELFDRADSTWVEPTAASVTDA